jgi:hypothetical protein
MVRRRSIGTSGARRRVSLAGRVQRGSDGSELVGVQRFLDAPEQRPFLVAHVVSQQLAEDVERRNIGATLDLDVGHPAADVDVLDKDAHDVRVVGSRVTRERRQEQFLFKTEVFATLLAPEVDRRALDGLGIGGRGALQAQSELERDVVLAGEHGQFFRSLHGLDRTFAKPASRAGAA